MIPRPSFVPRPGPLPDVRDVSSAARNDSNGIIHAIIDVSSMPMACAPARRRTLLSLLVLGLLAWPTLGGAVQFRDEGPGAVLEGLAIDAEVDGRYVGVTVEATLAGPTLVTGELRFPLPPGAVLYEAAVYVPEEERWSIAETLGRRQGRQVFDAAPSEPRTSPLLVQQIGRDFYRAKVHAPDEADRLRIRIRYAHLIERTEDGYALRIALANPDLGRSAPAALSLRLDAPAGWRVLGMRGPGLANIHEGGLAMVDPAHDLDDDLWIDLEPAAPHGPVGGLTYLPGAAPDEASEAVRARLVSHTHLHLTPDLSAYAQAPRRLVLLLDRSGSMAGDKLTEARRGVARVIERLGPEDRFSIIAFDNQAVRFSDGLVGIDRVPEALAFLDGIHDRGGTDIFGALSAAGEVADADADIVLITDGRPTAGVGDANRTLGALEAERRALRIFAFGIGHDLDQNYLVELARGSGGDVAFALDDGEIAGDLFALCDGAVQGGVRDAELRADDETLWSGRALPGDELYVGVRGPTPAELRLVGSSAQGPMAQDHAVPELPAGDGPLHRLAAPLTAKALADRLEREIDLDGETDARVDAAVRLARAYGIITRYSSQLALIDEADYAERGVQRLTRDPAGIALEAVDGAEEDEGRIGGAGIPGADSDGDGIDDADDDRLAAPPPAGADAGAPPAHSPDDPSADPSADGDAWVGCSARPGHAPLAPLGLGLLLLLAGLRRR